MDINCILMKYYFHVHDHDCCIFIPIRDPKINKSQFSHPPAIKPLYYPLSGWRLIKRFRTPGPVSVLTQSGSNFLGLDQDDIQVQITGCYKVITQRLILIKGLRYTIAMVPFYKNNNS